MKKIGISGVAVAMLLALPGWAGPMALNDAATLFGSRPAIEDISLSPDGRHVAIVGQSGGRSSVLFVSGDDGQLKAIARSDGIPSRLTGCGWSAADRLVCRQYGISDAAYGVKLPYIRLFSIGADGGAVKQLSRTGTGQALRISQFTGGIVDWTSGADGSVLMERDFVPEMTTGSLTANRGDGLGVERVDTRTLRATTVETPRSNAAHYLSDGQGHVRIMVLNGTSDGQMLNGRVSYLYRPAAGGAWRPLATNDSNDNGVQPIAVDASTDSAYALKKLDGRMALYRLALDGSARIELVYARPDVDIDDVVRVGRAGRVIGATYVTDQRRTEYFDPAYRKLAASLTRAVPGLPLISFTDASADESHLLLRAGSDVEPGRYFLLDRTSHKLETVMSERPGLDGRPMATMKAVSYPAADGTSIPAYLTLPVGSDGRNLPAIVMPHGGPAYRDEWGFDWLVQFFAARGFAVLQPQFRGSTGYGDEWFRKNGFKDWRIAIGDVTAAGRWLVAQHIADPDKLAIVGWSYGGYAALQSAAIEPTLYKAVIAIAPATDFAMLKAEGANWTSSRIAAAYIGTGPHIVEGSPLRRAASITAPVLMFHGDQDLNVSIAESRAMAHALHDAGKQATLVAYPGLDHQLPDSAIRVDLLTRSDAFLRKSLRLPD